MPKLQKAQIPVRLAQETRLLYNTRETCELLGGISARSLRRLVIRGLIRPTTLLRVNLFPLAEIQRLINDNADAPTHSSTLPMV